MRRALFRGSVCIAVAIAAAAAWADFNETLPPAVDHKAIEYFTHSLRDPVSELNERLRSGDVRFKFEERGGYLRPVLEALDVPVESQIAVFSKTSLQADLIDPRNPRAIYFNDRVAVGWMPGGFIEIVSLDPEQGAMFYLLQQDLEAPQRFVRTDSCLRCHMADATLGVPGMVHRSVYTAPGGEALLVYGDTIPDHRAKIEDRWGGWYVTGETAGVQHMGNALVADRDRPRASMTGAALQTLDGRFPIAKYLSPHSDAAALLVFDHQMHMINLLTRYGWEVRVAKHDRDPRLARIVEDGAREVAEYMLFTHEARLPGSKKMGGDSGFAKTFEARGPRDPQGRSLRELDLTDRLLKYRLSYMIYSPAFDALPDEAREAVYRSLWEALSKRGAEGRAAIEIVRATKTGLPEFFR